VSVEIQRCRSPRPVSIFMLSAGCVWAFRKALSSRNLGEPVKIRPIYAASRMSQMRQIVQCGEPISRCEFGTLAVSPVAPQLPAQNVRPAGRVLDDASSSITIAPDGSILYGAYTRYDFARGHLMRFDAGGHFLGSYSFGWDSTPAIYRHDGTYSIVIKDNEYGGGPQFGSYCNTDSICPPRQNGPFFITQLSPSLAVEWKFQNTNNQKCIRNTDGTITCVPNTSGTQWANVGFEWCINAPVVDANGTVYANSEDGNLYAISQGGTLKANIFLNLALGAAYTPLAIGPDGKIYTENKGTLVVIGQ